MTRSNQRSRGILGITAVLTLILSVVQYAATAPYMIQRMFVRFCQPFLLSGIIVLYYTVIRSPIYIAIFALAVLSLVGYVIYKYWSSASSQSKGRLAVQPILDKLEDDHDKPIEINRNLYGDMFSPEIDDESSGSNSVEALAITGNGLFGSSIDLNLLSEKLSLEESVQGSVPDYYSDNYQPRGVNPRLGDLTEDSMLVTRDIEIVYDSDSATSSELSYRSIMSTSSQSSSSVGSSVPSSSGSEKKKLEF
jgi:Ca2+/Na+ antiporter